MNIFSKENSLLKNILLMKTLIQAENQNSKTSNSLKKNNKKLKLNKTYNKISIMPEWMKFLAIATEIINLFSYRINNPKISTNWSLITPNNKDFFNKVFLNKIISNR
jgi:hypothetical protein